MRKAVFEDMNFKINENEKKVLLILASEYDEAFFYFSAIVEETKLELHQVRRACRSLRKKGLAEFSQLFDDEGMINGSGYGCSFEGKKLVDSFDAIA